MLRLKDLQNKSNYPELKELIASHKMLWDISNLELFPMLAVLSLGFNSIKDISVLRSLPLLQEVYLQHNLIISIKPLFYLEQLKVLDVSHNQVTDIDVQISYISCKIVKYYPQNESKSNLYTAISLLVGNLEKQEMQDLILLLNSNKADI